MLGIRLLSFFGILDTLRKSSFLAFLLFEIALDNEFGSEAELEVLAEGPMLAFVLEFETASCSSSSISTTIVGIAR